VSDDRAMGEFLHNILNPDLPPGPPWTHTFDPSVPSFTCPRCDRTSYNEFDVREGFCGACHAWTGTPAPPEL
jgi:hypothetical protein